MIRPQRVIHRFVWLLLPPALLLALFYFSAPDTALSPPNDANAPAALRAIGKGPLN